MDWNRFRFLTSSRFLRNFFSTNSVTDSLLVRLQSSSRYLSYWSVLPVEHGLVLCLSFGPSARYSSYYDLSNRSLYNFLTFVLGLYYSKLITSRVTPKIYVLRCLLSLSDVSLISILHFKGGRESRISFYWNIQNKKVLEYMVVISRRKILYIMNWDMNSFYTE